MIFDGAVVRSGRAAWGALLVAAIAVAAPGLAGAKPRAVLASSDGGPPQAHAAKVTLAKGAASARPVRGGGARLRWTTRTERGNVGFTLYRARRATPRKRTLLLSRMVAGTVVKLGRTKTNRTATVYQRFDPRGRRGDRYFFRDVDVSGRTRLHGPYVVRSKAVARPANSPLLAPVAAKPSRPAAPIGLSGPAVPVSPPSAVIEPGTPPDQAQTQLASRQTARLDVDRDGWTRVELAALEHNGVDVSVPANLHVFTGGSETAALIRGGGLEFYGQPVDTLDTAARAYFVDAETGPGLRANVAPASASAPAAPDSFPSTSVHDGRSLYYQGLRNGAASNFFGDIVGGAGVSLSLAAPNRGAATGGQVTVSLQGLTAGDHAVAVSLNGTALGAVGFTGQQAATRSFDVDAVAAGTNTVRLASGGSGDVSLTGPVTLRYAHTLAADDGVLNAAVPGGRRADIAGLAGGGARVMDVTNPTVPLVLDADTAGGRVAATAPGTGIHRLLAFTPAAVGSPARVEPGFPSQLSDPAADGALTMIAPAPFLPALEPLAAQRREEGLSVKLVALQDVYDEFSYGQADATAVSRMLASARATWRTPPQYVLLGGDGTYDPRGLQGDGTAGNVVPVALIDGAGGETASDSTLTGTLATGRLPARTPQDLAALVAKTLRYARQSSTSSALLASDLDDTWNFTGSSDQLKPLLPAGWAVGQVRRAQNGAHSQLIAGLNAGPSVVNYAGHGAVERWRGDLLTEADADGLTNTGDLSLFVFMTCLNGYFVDPTLPALAESLVTAPGGGVAVFSSTGETTPGPQEAANQALFSALFGGAPPRLGDAIVASLSATDDPGVRATWTLLGDPTLVIH